MSRIYLIIILSSWFYALSGQHTTPLLWDYDELKSMLHVESQKRDFIINEASDILKQPYVTVTDSRKAFLATSITMKV